MACVKNLNSTSQQQSFALQKNTCVTVAQLTVSSVQVDSNACDTHTSRGNGDIGIVVQKDVKKWEMVVIFHFESEVNIWVYVVLFMCKKMEKHHLLVNKQQTFSPRMKNTNVYIEYS